MTKEEWDKLPPKIRESLKLEGYSPASLRPTERKNLPSTRAGLSNVTEATSLKPTADIASTFYDPTDPQRRSAIVYDPLDPHEQLTSAHEYEHALATQGLGSGKEINTKWDELIGKEGATRKDIVERMIKHAPYLQKTWNLPKSHATGEGYFASSIAGQKGTPDYLNEQLATLSALEQAKKSRFVEDPYVRKNILTTPAERETYEALTGLRQSRLDPRDLPPYTRQPGSTDLPGDKDAGFMGKIKSMIGLAGGGMVAAPKKRKSKIVKGT